MTWSTHALVGANAAWIATQLPANPDHFFVYLATGAIVALLPDIDATAAKIHFLGGGVLGGVRGIFQHRGFFHSIMGTLVVTSLAYVALVNYDVVLIAVIALGYISHPIIDGLNKPGVQYLFPLKTKFRLLPKSLTSPLKGFWDQVLFAVGVAGCVLLLLNFQWG